MIGIVELISSFDGEALRRRFAEQNGEDAVFVPVPDASEARLKDLFREYRRRPDPGRVFSIVVLMSGVLCLLVMLPFAFIQYVYAPWLEAQKKGETPRSLPEGTRGHILLVGLGPLTLNLADDLDRYGFDSVLMCPDTSTTLDPVSYTHLDVYKRQGQQRNRKGRQRRQKKRGVNARDGEKHGRKP